MNDDHGRPPFAGPLAMTRGSVDRGAHHRLDDAWLAAARADASSLVVNVGDGRLEVTTGPARTSLRWSPAAELGDDDAEWFYLGSCGGHERFVRWVHEGVEDLPTLRELAAELDDDDGALAAAAVALTNWHATHPRCPRCGEPTVAAQAGWTRHCPADGSEHYPRTDPAVIMAVLDDADRILLGRAPTWPETRMSTLAGFVEPGESIEDAVRREVAEETTVVVGEVTYLASQPWPFPASLMIGCEARATSLEIAVDGVEMAHAQWFSRDALVRDLERGTLSLPTTASISRRLIERWFGGPIPRA